MVCRIPFHEGDTFSFDGMGYDHRRSVSHAFGLFQGIDYLTKVETIDFQDMPIPSEPPGISPPGPLWSGWPCRRLLIFRRVLSSLVGRCPASARVEYKTGAACPFERTNLSRWGQSGRLGACRIL